MLDKTKIEKGGKRVVKPLKGDIISEGTLLTGVTYKILDPQNRATETHTHTLVLTKKDTRTIKIGLDHLPDKEEMKKWYEEKIKAPADKRKAELKALQLKAKG